MRRRARGPRMAHHVRRRRIHHPRPPKTACRPCERRALWVWGAGGRRDVGCADVRMACAGPLRTDAGDLVGDRRDRLLKGLLAMCWRRRFARLDLAGGVGARLVGTRLRSEVAAVGSTTHADAAVVRSARACIRQTTIVSTLQRPVRRDESIKCMAALSGGGGDQWRVRAPPSARGTRRPARPRRAAGEGSATLRALVRAKTPKAKA